MLKPKTYLLGGQLRALSVQSVVLNLGADGDEKSLAAVAAACIGVGSV